MKKHDNAIQKVINFDDITKENTKEHKLNWPKISDHPFRIFIIGGSGSAKTNTLLNLISLQVDIDSICLYEKDPNEGKY